MIQGKVWLEGDKDEVYWESEIQAKLRSLIYEKRALQIALRELFIQCPAKALIRLQSPDVQEIVGQPYNIGTGPDATVLGVSVRFHRNSFLIFRNGSADVLHDYEMSLGNQGNWSIRKRSENGFPTEWIRPDVSFDVDADFESIAIGLGLIPIGVGESDG